MLRLGPLRRRLVLLVFGLGIYPPTPAWAQDEAGPHLDSRDDFVVLEMEGYLPPSESDEVFIPLRAGLRGYFPLPASLDTNLFGVFRMAAMRVAPRADPVATRVAWPLRLGLGLGWVGWERGADVIYGYGLVMHGESVGLGSGYAWISESTLAWERNTGWGSFGLAISVLTYIDQVFVWPFPLLDWRIGPDSRLVFRGDDLEFRQFLSRSLCLAMGVRYDLDVYALSHSRFLAWEQIAAEAGPNIGLGSGLFLKLRARRGIYGDKRLGSDWQGAETYSTDDWSFRLMLTLSE